MDFSQGPGYGIRLAGAANPNSKQFDSRARSAAAKQRADFLHGVVKTAPYIGGDLVLLQHSAMVVNYSQCQLRTSNVNRSDQDPSLS
jgi:hypothetical protein